MTTEIVSPHEIRSAAALAYHYWFMTPFRHSIAVWVAIVASLSCFIASLGMPALEFTVHEPVKGYVTLLWGWWGLFTYDFPWLANPLYFIALFVVLMGDRRTGQILSSLAFGFGLLSLWVREWWFSEASATPVEKLGTAFYFWLASFAVLLLLLFFGRKPAKSVESRSDP